MNINSLSAISPESIQASGSITHKVSLNQSSTEPAQGDNSDLSREATFLSDLQQTQQIDPALFQKVTAFVASRLQNAAQNAAKNGDTTRSAMLNQLAAEFQDGQVPTMQSMEQAGLTGKVRPRYAHDWMEASRAMKDAINDARGHIQSTAAGTLPALANE